MIFDSETFNNLNVTIAGSYNAIGTTTFQSAAGAAPPVEFDANVTRGTLNLTTGTLTGAGTVTVTGLLSWTGGTMSGAGTTNASGGLAISGSGAALDARTLNITANASATWTGPGSITLGKGAVLDNQRGATFTVQNQGDQGIFGDMEPNRAFVGH